MFFMWNKYLAQDIKIRWLGNKKHLEILDQMNLSTIFIKMEIHDLKWFTVCKSSMKIKFAVYNE